MRVEQKAFLKRLPSKDSGRNGPVNGCLAVSGLLLICGITWASDGAAPSIDDLRNLTYRGLLNGELDVSLHDGAWQGEPWVEDGAAAPSAQLVGALRVTADFDGDGRQESANLVNYSGGGTGQFVHLAVSRIENGQAVNVATVLLGDRVDIRALRAEGDVIALDLVQAGPNDAACCPGDVLTRRWRLEADRLVEQAVQSEPVRLSVATLEGSRWLLSRWSWAETVEESAAISLEISDGRFAGAATCNRYFAEAQDMEFPGGIRIGPVGSTRRACPDEQAQAREQRFLDALSGVTQFSFVGGELVFSYSLGDTYGTLFFVPDAEQP